LCAGIKRRGLRRLNVSGFTLIGGKKRGNGRFRVLRER
jgi:hypothetical protein